MKHFKRIFALLAVLALLLCGCAEGGQDGSSEPSQKPSESNTPTQTTAAPTVNDGKVTYTVTVLDQNGNPVEGVAIQFCDPVNCKLPVATNADGVVTASYEESEYHILLAELPAGYSSEETEFYFGDATELTVTIHAD